MKRIYESLMTDLTVPSIVELSDSQTDDLFNLVDLGRNDVFYDLGSGTGKVVINAYKKRNVRKAIGIEHNKKYYDISKKRTKEISNLDLDKNIDFWHGDYSEHNEDKYHFDISDATVVYNSLAPSGKASFYNSQFDQKKVAIVKKDLPLGGYKPVRVSRQDPNAQFFLIYTPLDKYRIHSKSEWAYYVLGKNARIDDVFEYYRQLWKKNNHEKMSNKIEYNLEKLINKYLPQK